jgi:prophage tail gpP-like protein
MAYFSDIRISGVSADEIYNYTLSKSYNVNNAASSFIATIDNLEGKNKNDFVLGNEITIYADSGINPPTTLNFTGILEDVQFRGSNQDEKIELSGRDYTARLMDRTVEPEVYTNLLAGSIVKDIIAKYTNNITTTNVLPSTFTVQRIHFNHKPVYDAINQLAELAGFTFYVDINKDLHFEPAGSISSGFTFNSGNVIDAQFKQQRDTVFNQIWIYGDRYLDGFKETFNAGSPLGGSIFTLLYNPHNTEVTVSGATIQPGAVADISVTPASGTKYLVNFTDKLIVFTSGTNLGANIPASGNAVVVNYKRALPIVKVGDNETSKSIYGTRVKVTIDKDIKDPNTAKQLLLKELAEFGDPATEGTLKVQGLYNVTPGQTCIVNLPNHGINNQTYEIVEAIYDFSKENNLTGEIMTIKVNKAINDITDTFKQALLDLKKIQAGDINDSDLLTRFQYTTGSIGIRQSGTIVTTRLINDSFILGHPYNGILGITKPRDVGSITSNITYILGNNTNTYNYALNFPASGLASIIFGGSVGTGSNNIFAVGPGSSLTCTMWIYHSGAPLGNYAIRLFETNYQGAWYPLNFRMNSGTQLVPTIARNDGVVNPGVTSSITIPINTWSHIAGVYNAINRFLLLYVNGSNAGSIADSTTSSLMSGNQATIQSAIWGNDTTLARSFIGYIDDFRYFSGPLTLAQIGSEFNKQYSYHPEYGLLAWYKFDESLGSLFYNSVSGTSTIQPLLGDRRGGSTIQFSGSYLV